jgi:hypothetical protein
MHECRVRDAPASVHVKDVDTLEVFKRSIRDASAATHEKCLNVLQMYKCRVRDVRAPAQINSTRIRTSHAPLCDGLVSRLTI